MRNALFWKLHKWSRSYTNSNKFPSQAFGDSTLNVECTNPRWITKVKQHCAWLGKCQLMLFSHMSLFANYLEGCPTAPISSFTLEANGHLVDQKQTNVLALCMYGQIKHMKRNHVWVILTMFVLWLYLFIVQVKLVGTTWLLTMYRVACQADGRDFDSFTGNKIKSGKVPQVGCHKLGATLKFRKF